MSEIPNKATFEQYLNKQFSVSGNDQSAELELAQVTVPERFPAQFECFNLLFKGDDQALLEQAIYRFESEGFPPTDLFLVPVAGDQTGYDYEVVINRKIEAASS